MSGDRPEAAAGSVGERLAGSTILVTGGSGFLGKAVLSTLLGRLGGFRRVIVLLRAADDGAARRRLEREVLASDAFAALPRGSLEEMLGSGRLTAVAGDLGLDEVRPRRDWHEIDTVIHCAATVSFEEPIDHALALNAFGPSRLLGGLRGLGARPHLVHVSTAYVAERQAERVAEDGPPHPMVGELDPWAMLEAGREWRRLAERESRKPALLRRFAREAKRRAARSPERDAGEWAEELRGRWVRQRLSEQGRRRAVEAGWPDTYALSKAIGERLVVEGSEHTTIVRPSIIESALRDPRPGWLEGIKVADPLILAYAAGGLTHLPGRAGNRIDIVPVDYVANACLAAAAHPPSGRLRRLAVTSGARNALTLGELAGQIKAYFRREPLRRRDGSPIEIGELEFVDRGLALRKAVRRERLAKALARAAAPLPLPASTKGALGRNGALAAQITRMVRIYGPYTELDCVFDDSNTHALARSLHPDDRAELPFDTGEIAWEDYLQRIHLPQVRHLSERRAGESSRSATVVYRPAQTQGR